MDFSSLNPAALKDKALSWVQIVKNLPFDGGADATRWVFLQVAAVVSVGFLILIVAAAHWIWTRGVVDPGTVALILGLGTALLAFPTNAQKTKLLTDSKTPGAASVIDAGMMSSAIADEGKR